MLYKSIKYRRNNYSDKKLGISLKEKYYNMDTNDFKVLSLIERLMKKYGFVPLELIEKASKLPSSSIKRTIQKLLDFHLIVSETSPFYGYQLTFDGLDMLSVRFYFNKNIISDLGHKINTGKESDIYIAQLVSGKESVIKFHREGRTSFKAIKRKREFDFKKWISWIDLSKKVALREFKILNELWKNGANVPEPIYNNRNSFIMEKIDGIELYKLKYLDKEIAKIILNDIIITLRIAYTKIGIIHGDLSPYNIIVSNNEKPRSFIIDWPQYIRIKNKNSDIVLKKELEYLAFYLHKKSGVEVKVEELINNIKGGIDGR